MLEPRRSQYLRALGIDVYVSRFILPGAAESQALAWESVALNIDNSAALDIAEQAGAAEINSVASNAAAINASTTDVITNVITDVAATVRQRSLPADLDVDLTPPATRRVNPAAALVPAASGDIHVAAPKFALSVVVSSCGILIVDSAPANSGARSEYLRLLGNILLAVTAQPAQPQLDVFLWPAVKHPQLDQGAAAARETLAAHLHNQIQQHAINTVLLLGEAAQQWCAFDDVETLRCVKSVSALACLQAPQHKRQLWQDIRHLAAAR